MPAPPVPCLAVALFLWMLSGCRHPAPGGAGATGSPAAVAAPLAAGALLPSPRLIIGRVISVDRERGVVIVELAADAPAEVQAAGTELITRTLDLRETGRLRVARFVRGRTLGTTTISGQPAANDEVAWLAP